MVIFTGKNRKLFKKPYVWNSFEAGTVPEVMVCGALLYHEYDSCESLTMVMVEKIMAL
jgi:hypothetical protein